MIYGSKASHERTYSMNIPGHINQICRRHVGGWRHAGRSNLATVPKMAEACWQAHISRTNQNSIPNFESGFRWISRGGGMMAALARGRLQNPECHLEFPEELPKWVKLAPAETMLAGSYIQVYSACCLRPARLDHL